MTDTPTPAAAGGFETFSASDYRAMHALKVLAETLPQLGNGTIPTTEWADSFDHLTRLVGEAIDAHRVMARYTVALLAEVRELETLLEEGD